MSNNKSAPRVLALATSIPSLARALPVDEAEAMRQHGPAWARDAAALAPWRMVMPPWARPGESWLAGGGEADPPVLLAGPCSSVLDLGWALPGFARLPTGTSLLGVSQWAGRGQMRRVWNSPPENLHLAVVWPREGVLAGRMASLAAGLVLAEALERHGVSCSIKWPNDILHDGKKVGGMLVEERDGGILVGMGLNLRQAPPPEAMREFHAVPAGDLRAAWPDSGPLGCWLRLWPEYGKFLKMLQFFDEVELAAMVERRLAWLGRAVLLRDAQDSHGRIFDNMVATVVGVGIGGGLRIRLQESASPREAELVSGSVVPASG